MTRGTKWAVGTAVVGAVLLVAAYQPWFGHGSLDDLVVEEVTEYHEPPETPGLELADDRLEDKRPPFDPEMVAKASISGNEWEVNKSAAVIKLDCPTLNPDEDQALLQLRPSYAEVVRAFASELLPSANMVDAAAKQFDDGLYAALDLACYRGELGLAPAVPEFVREIFGCLPADSPARPFLAAALELAGTPVSLAPEEQNAAAAWLRGFQADEVRSKPIGFYTWTPELRQVWRVLKFLQTEFDERGLATPRAIAAVLQSDPHLAEQCRVVNAFYGRLTNPLICVPVHALIGTTESVAQLAARLRTRHATAALLPPSTSRETELFEDLFASGVPPDASLMVELIRRVRSGEVDLTPGPEDGWYQHQAYALESMLLPSEAQEQDKLLLTAKYKKRLVEAFEALITKRRETHARGQTVASTIGWVDGGVPPKLRVEPCATFYLRTARAYGFVQDFLLSTVGREFLASRRGLREGGERPLSLADELEAVRQRFYGSYLVVCDDIGMKPQFAPDERVDAEAARTAALAWLSNAGQDADLACDVRVSVPVARDQLSTRLWGVLGVRVARLEADYARPPSVRAASRAPWEELRPDQLAIARYLIPVDEFAEFALSGSHTLSREELRAVCNKYKTKERILEALAEQ